MKEQELYQLIDGLPHRFLFPNGHSAYLRLYNEQGEFVCYLKDAYKNKEGWLVGVKETEEH